jgi:hypothetical protein
MSKKGSGVAELKERLQNNPTLSFVEKAELCVYGRNYTAQTWAREYSAYELLEMWKSRKHAQLREVAELAEVKARVEKIWNPRIGDLEAYRRENGGDPWELFRICKEVQAIFYGADERIESEWIAYWDRYGHETYRHQLAATYGEEALYICHAALHPVWAAILCFSRQSLPITEEHLQNWHPPEDWIPGDGVCIMGALDGLRKNDTFLGLEQLTEPLRMTTGDLQKRLASLGIVSDLKTIREAATALGIPPLDAMRGFKAGTKKRRPKKRPKPLNSF